MGKPLDCAWFHFTGQADPGYKVEELALIINLDGEGCVFSPEGVLLRGVTTVKSVFDSFEKATLHTLLGYNRAVVVNLMENELGDASLPLQLHPFEILSLRFE